MTRDPGFRQQRFSGTRVQRSEHAFAADRGRLAETPSEIPARGWKDILWRVYARITECRVIAVAAGVAFYVLLAIFPAIAALIAIYGLFADPGAIASHLDSISSFVPGGAIEVLRDQMSRLAAQGAGTLGLAFIVGLAVFVVERQRRHQGAVRRANHRLRREGEARFRVLQLDFVGLTLAAIVFLLLALGLVAVMP